MGFHWSLRDSKSPQVSRARLRILAVLSNAVIWIVFTHPPTSKSSRPFNNPLVIVPKAPITIGTIVTLMFHSFFNSLARSRYYYYHYYYWKLFTLVNTWSSNSLTLGSQFSTKDITSPGVFWYGSVVCISDNTVQILKSVHEVNVRWKPGCNH